MSGFGGQARGVLGAPVLPAFGERRPIQRRRRRNHLKPKSVAVTSIAVRYANFAPRFLGDFYSIPNP